MWQVENDTPFAAAGNWVRDRDGAEIWIVAVRCTLEIHADGTTAVASVQDPPVLAPVFFGDPAKSSLRYDSDFHLTKPTTDILLHGHAYAPHGRPASETSVTMRVGDVSKTLRILGSREYEQGLQASSAQPFVRVPIRYEMTYGGGETDLMVASPRPKFDPRNPVGTGFIATAGTPAPNIVYPSGSADRPAGFGPIAPHWHPRVTYAGTYDDAWQKHRLPLYPTDLDDRFFLCSPEDQRPREHLRGGELVELINLAADGPMSFVLPCMAFRFETQFRGKPAVTHRSALCTVILEPDEHRLVMVWQSWLPAHADVHRLEQTVVKSLQVLNVPARSVPHGVVFDDD